MPRVEEVDLDFATLAILDEGRPNLMLMNQVGIASRDCINRPADKTKRKIHVELSFEPETDDAGECVSVMAFVEVKQAKLPVYRTRRLAMRPTNKGFRFNRDFADTLDQPALPGTRADD